MNRQLALLLAIFVGGLLMLRSGLFAADAATAGLAFLLLLLCAGPSLAWVWGGMRHLPIFEVYALMHLIYYWYPAGNQAGTVLGLEPEQRAVFLGAASLFLAAGWAVYVGMLRRMRRSAQKSWRFWSEAIPAMQGSRVPWLLLGFWLAYNTLFQYGSIWSLVPAAAMPLVRALSTAAGLLGIFVLAHKAGEGKLSVFQTSFFVIAIMTGTLISFASGYLGVGTLFVGNAFFAYMVGKRRLPVVSLTLFLLLVSFLNYGKSEMRVRYWLMGESTDDMVELYSHWFKSSWEQFNLPADLRQGSTSGFERANLTSVYVEVVTQTPHPLPYLQGKTYLDSLQLFIPRVIWPDRPSLHVVMNEVGLRYGIHTTVESTESTMISIGQLAEAWANGGWLGVGLVGGFFGFFYSVGVRLAYQRGYTTVGFLFGTTFVGFAANLEHMTGTLLMAFYQAAIGSLVLLYSLSRRSFQPMSPVAPARLKTRVADPARPLKPSCVDE